MVEKKKKREEPHPADAYPCPVCGGRSFTWGRPSESHGFIRFLAAGRSSFNLFGAPGEKMLARKCNECRNVLLFTVT
jgi:hypothetical protein